MKPAVVSLFLLSAAVATAQTPAPPEVQALRNCAELSDRKQTDSAAAVGRTAESIYRRRISRNARDVDALVGLGRVLAQCILPAEGFMGQGTVSQEAMEVLENALDLAPTNWGARFVLASIAYRSPAFLGRGDIAAKHFDELLRQQGNRSLEPMYARVYEYRGMQLMRAGRTDSARALWTRGLSLFPKDSALAAIIARTNATPVRKDTVTEIPMMTITARAERAPTEPPVPPAREIGRGEILATAGGGADVFSAVQALPGATRMGEGSSVYTRGGDAGETATILNGSRVLSLSRFEGLNGGTFGALEPWVVKSMRYSTGAFSARHGNALSGIIDIETDGRPRERRTRVGLSLVQAAGTAWMPAGRKAGGWVSARVSQTGALLATHGRTAEFDGAPHSEEAIGSLIATPTPGTELRATAMIASDGSRRIVNAAGWRGPFSSDGDTRALMLSSRWQPAAALTLRGNMSAATRSSDFTFGILSRERDDRSLTARMDVEYALDELTFRVGAVEGAYDRRDRGVVPTSPSVAEGAPSRVLEDARSGASERGVYAETELTRGGSSLVLGVRGDRLPGEVAVTADPRAAIAHRAGNWTMRLAGGVFHQGRWRPEAAIPDAGTPSGTPGSARHLVTTLEHESHGRTARVEFYRKRYSDYSTFGAGPRIVATAVNGMDVLLDHRASGPLSGWIAYSLLSARSTLADRREIRSPFDVTHTASASTTATLGDWSLGLTGRYGTGAPTTPVIGTTGDANGFPQPAHGSPMSERLPHYARLDTRLMRHIRLPSVLVTSFAEVINVTGRRNVAGVTYDASYRNREYMHAFFASRTVVLGAELQFR
ncbi:MAG TPA: hypothetical protein VFO55_00030 [Gemmatimonadaceae bacterium]|nr:hypothetical protein [Gemmatimonadaceae bacterium]